MARPTARRALALALALAGCKRSPEPRAAVDVRAEAERPGWAVYAVQYARSRGVPVAELVAGGGPGARVDMSWHFYVLAGNGKVVAVDAGTDQLAGDRALRRRWRVAEADTVERALARLGLAPRDVDAVLLTHGHFDHADGIAAMPDATVYAHADEWAAMTGPDRRVRGAAERVAADGRKRELSGGESIPGLVDVEPRLAGRHTRGHLVYLVRCRGGARLALAGDGAYLYENLERRAPITVTRSSDGNVADMAALVSEVGLEAVVPGHDPRVFTRFARGAAGVARLCP